MSVRAVALLSALALAGCGADDTPAPVTSENDDSPSLASPTPTATPSPAGTPPTATAPSAPAPPPDAGVAEGHGAEDAEGGAGDEEAARTPVDLVLDGEGLTPPRVAVAPFLGIEVTVRNDLPTTARIRPSGGGDAVRVPAGGTRSFELEGLRRGRRYTLDAGPGQDAIVVATAEPGP